MASVNPVSRELVFKIVYYGPGLCGKTTTLEHLHATAKPEHRGKLVSLATPVDRTLYFDFLPVRLPPIRGMHVRLQLFTVPGQVYFNATRKLVLTGADGVVFVSDSQVVRADANLESLENLRENLAEQGRELAAVPLVFQHNKRDLPDLLPVPELDSMLNPFGAPSLATSAKTGVGVYEALERISERVLAAFKDRLPELYDVRAESSFAAVEGGLIHALRDATTRAAPPSDVVVARIDAPGASLPLLDGDLGSSPAPPAAEPGASAAPDAVAAVAPPSPLGAPPRRRTAQTLQSMASVAYSPGPNVLPAPPQFAMAQAEPQDDVRATDPPRTTVGAFNGIDGIDGIDLPPSRAPRSSASEPGEGMSFAELWPEGEHAMVRELEAAMARGRYWRAIELCETLVSRVLASAGGLFGTNDAPRDPAMIPILLGLDARRYLAFRSIVRQAHDDGLITAREALAAYAFAIDCRLARSSIR